MAIQEEYRPGREGPDSRLTEIKKHETPGVEEKINVCVDCNGIGEIAIKDDEGKVTGTKTCEKCDGLGAII